MLALMNDFEKWDYLEVLWADSASIPSGWTASSDIEASPDPCVSVGMLLAQNDYALTLVLSRDMDNGDINSAIIIPWVAIKSIRKLVPE